MLDNDSSGGQDPRQLTPEERRPACDCSPTVHPAIAAHVRGCASDGGASRWELLDHADAMDDEVARLDALVRELADALRPWPSTGKIGYCALDVAALLARVDERTHR